MTPLVRQVHAWAAWAFVAGIVVQVFLVGAAIPQLGGSGDFRTHVEFGYTLGIVVLVVVLAAAVARRPRREIGLAVAMLVLYVVQTSLPYFRGSVPAVAALHPVNALLLFGLAVWYARRAWASRAATTTGA